MTETDGTAPGAEPRGSSVRDDRTGQPVIQPAERDLLVFIASRMPPERIWIRDEAEQALRRLTFVRAWRFERTPPSSEHVDDSYLRHVRDADFFVWLADDDASNAVENEVTTALTANVPTLVFLLPAAERSDRLKKLLARARDRVRTCTLPTEADLREALPLAVGDELIRALRGCVPSRKRALLSAGLDSRGRVIAHLETAGVPRRRAVTLADHPVVLPPLDRYVPDADRRLVIVAAPVGAGKSFIAERCMQQAIAIALEDPMAPVPLYTRLASLPEALPEWVERRAGPIGDPRLVGAFVVLDGADESGARPAVQVLEEARVLVNAFPATRVLLTSRPLPGISDARERVDVPELSQEDAQSLIEHVSGRDDTGRMYWSLDTSVREAVRRPLFAVMYGALYADDQPVKVRTRADIVRELVEHVLRGRGDLAAGLEELAARAIAGGEGHVHRSELGAYAELQTLLNTALLTEDGVLIRFGLAVFQDWFGAQHLLRPGAFEAALTSPLQRDRWHASTLIAIAQATPERGNQILLWLLAVDPGFAFRVIDECVASHGFGPNATLGRGARAYGEEVQLATQEMARALGAIGLDIFPVNGAGRPYSFAVGTDRDQLLYGRLRDQVEPRVIELAASGLREARDWTVRGHASIEDRPGWAFNFVLRDVRRRLQELLSASAIQVTDCPQYDREMAWLLALTLLQRGEFNHRPIPLAEVRARDDWLERGAWVRRRSTIIPCDPLLDAIDAGEELTFPWTPPDREPPPHWIWAPYSDDQMLRRTRDVYSAAMQIYRALVSARFSSIAERLEHWRLFPARLIGILDPGSPLGFEGHPGLHSYFEPLPEASADEIRIELGPRSAHSEPANLDAVYRTERPDASWLRPWTQSSLIEIFGPAPATQLAYRWLCDDLTAIGLIESMTREPEY